MKLNSISFEPNAIILKVSASEQHGEAKNLTDSKITAEDAPLPELTAAFAALPAVLCEIIEAPSDWAVGLQVCGLKISRTKHGTRSVELYAKKQLECRKDYLWPIDSPMVQIDDAAEGESGAVKIAEELSEIIATAIYEAERYMNGERAQGKLDFDKAKEGLQALADKGKKNTSQAELAGV